MRVYAVVNIYMAVVCLGLDSTIFIMDTVNKNLFLAKTVYLGTCHSDRCAPRTGV